MKIKAGVFCVVCLTMLLSGCGVGPGSQATADAVCTAFENAIFQGDFKTAYTLTAPVADELVGQVERKSLDAYLPDWQKEHAQAPNAQVRQVEINTPLFGGSAVSKNCTAFYALPGSLELQQVFIGVDQLADGKWYVSP
jgi:hypothetical protein